MKGFAEATGTELLAALAAGEVSAVELTRACLDRIAAVNPAVGAVLAVLPDPHDQAAASDAYRRSHTPRPLEGVPVLVKDNIAVTGLPTTAGSLALAASSPDDAALVIRLRAAGAVIVGKTNLSEWANFRSTASTSGWSAVGGQTFNPHDLACTPSGSSSGSGAAIAAGVAPLAVGTETDGSIISPAAICGIVGMKPTLGRVPGAGIVPISSAQDTAGPMTRSVADAALLFAVLVGAPVPDLSQATLRRARLGLWTPAGRDSATDEVLQRAADALSDAGATVVPVELDAATLEADEWPALLAEFRDEIDGYLAAAPGAAVRSLAELVRFNTNDPVELSRFGQEIFEQALDAPPVSDPSYREHRARATAAAQRMIDEALRGGAGLDAVVTLSNEPAWRIDYARRRSVRGIHRGTGGRGRLPECHRSRGRLCRAPGRSELHRRPRCRQASARPGRGVRSSHVGPRAPGTHRGPMRSGPRRSSALRHPITTGSSRQAFRYGLIARLADTRPKPTAAA